MISDEQQDQAALYALDLLSADESAVFERALAADAALQTLVRELRDTAGALALSVPQKMQPPAALKNRLLQQLNPEPVGPLPGNVIAPPASAFRTWIPWAIAAALLLSCILLGVDREKLNQRLAQEKAAQPILVALAPAEGAPPAAEAVVVWQPNRQAGVIKITHLPAAASGKDYQLWAIDSAHPDPISAGVIRVEDNETAQIAFKPTEAARDVKAFAISLERKGGAPKKEGPILLVGKI